MKRQFRIGFRDGSWRIVEAESFREDGQFLIFECSRDFRAITANILFIEEIEPEAPKTSRTFDRGDLFLSRA
jgi:hypothetical protein